MLVTEPSHLLANKWKKSETMLSFWRRTNSDPQPPSHNIFARPVYFRASGAASGA